MRQYIKEIGKESTIYSISNILTKAIGFILIPVYTKFLSTDQYGIISLVTSLIGFMATFYNFGMSAAWARFYFDFEVNSEKQKHFFGNIIIFVFSLGFISSLFFSFFGKNLFAILAPGVSFFPFILIAVWSSFFLNFYNIQLEIFRLERKAFRYGGYSVLKFTSTVIFTIIAVVILKYEAVGKVISEFIVVLIMALIIFFNIAKNIKLKIYFPFIKEALIFSFPLLFHQLSGLIYLIADKFFLVNYKGLSTTGIYNIGFQLGGIMNLIVSSIHLSWYTFFMQTVVKTGNESKTLISRLTTYYIMVILFLGMTITFFSDEIIRIFISSPEYFEAVKLIPVFVLAYFFQGLYNLEATKLYYDKKMIKILPVASFVSAVSNILLNFTLIPKYGMYGAAFSLLFSIIILYVIAFVFSQKAFKLSYEYGRLMKLCLVVILLVSLKYYFQTFSINFWLITALKTMLITLFPLYIVLGGGLNKSEFNNLLDIYRKIKIRYLNK